jgi:hypothetical protein
LLPDESEPEPLPVIVLLPWWGRTVLVGLGALAVGVFAIAVALNPYHADGTARDGETHMQMGLPPCTFRAVTGLPCPSCGMTTSFALFVRGDLLNSLRANCAGTLLAALSLAFIPWAFASAWRAQILVIRSVERTLMRLVIIFLIVMMVRWGIVLLVFYT